MAIQAFLPLYASGHTTSCLPSMVLRRQVSMFLQKTVEVHREQCYGKIVDVPVSDATPSSHLSNHADDDGCVTGSIL